MNDKILELIKEAYIQSENSPELNMNNYTYDDVDALNDAMINVYNLLEEANRMIDEGE